jgi:hypothetical protein
MAKEKKELTEAEKTAALRKQKIARDSKDLRKYRKRLENEMKNYRQAFCLVARNQRRDREEALGKCAMAALDRVKELAAEKKLVPGSLYYALSEEKITDPDGNKAYKYSVEFCVTSYEKAHSEEDINAEMNKVFEKMMEETDELFPKPPMEAAK